MSWDAEYGMCTEDPNYHKRDAHDALCQRKFSDDFVAALEARNLSESEQTYVTAGIYDDTLEYRRRKESEGIMRSHYLTNDEFRVVCEYRAQRAMSIAPVELLKVVKCTREAVVQMLRFGACAEEKNKDWLALLDHTKRIGWSD